MVGWGGGLGVGEQSACRCAAVDIIVIIIAIDIVEERRGWEMQIRLAAAIVWAVSMSTAVPDTNSVGRAIVIVIVIATIATAWRCRGCRPRSRCGRVEIVCDGRLLMLM